MDITIFDTIPYHPDLPDLMKSLHIRPDSPKAAELEDMVRLAQAIAQPKVVYKIAFIEGIEEDRVVIDGIPFTSRVLSTNLQELHRVYPFIATCGLELDAWAHGFTDMVYRFYADAIAESALSDAMEFIKAHLTSLFLPVSAELSEDRRPPKLVDMNPGSLKDWPIDQQKPLFALLRNGSERIGVHLSETFLMHPVKSVSGIYFVNQAGYVNCQLCPREICSGRKAPYDPELLEQRYARLNSERV
jgi:hypothetical protein